VATSRGNEERTLSIEDRLAATLHSAGCEGWVTALDIDSGAEVGLHPDQVVVAASVFKVAVALEFYRQAATGDITVTETVHIADHNRTVGPSGLANGRDPVTISLRDLASLMLSISDNTATDALMARVTLGRINATLQELGLRDTRIVNDLRGLIASIIEDVGVTNMDDLWALPEVERDARLGRCRALQPEHATHTTPRDMACLLRAIRRDEAGPAAACAEVRRLMGQQASHRLALGFPNGIAVQAKSGSLMGRIRNEIGLITYPDGRRYAVAVFTRSYRGASRQPAIDAAIGAVAALAIEQLRKV
jgi:beta-lactamase class A